MVMRNKAKKSILRVLAIGVSLAAVFAATSQPLRAQATHVTQDWAQTPPAFDNGDSLRDFEARLRSSLFLLKSRPELNEPLKLTGTVTAIGRTGIRRLRIRNFQLLSDGGRESGESNLAAGSWPSVTGALGSALAGDYLVQAAVKGIPIDDLELIFTSKPGTAPSKTTGTQVTYPRNLNYIVFITSPATDAQLEDLRKTVERVSPVFHLVTDGQKVDHGKLDCSARARLSMACANFWPANMPARKERLRLKGPARSRPPTIGGSRCALTSRSKAAPGSGMSARILVIFRSFTTIRAILAAIISARCPRKTFSAA